MRLTVKRTKKDGGTYRVYLPKQVGEQFQGDAECIVNALTLTIIKPGVNLKDVEESLEIVLRDIRLRRRQGEG